MSLENPTTLDKVIDAAKRFRYWKIVLIAASGLVLLGAVLFAMHWYQDWRFQSDMEKANANLAKELNTLSNIQRQKEQLDLDEARQKEIVIQAARDADEKAKIANEAKRQEEEKRNESNKALDHVNAVERRDFNGSHADDANRARCRAFPNTADCTR